MAWGALVSTWMPGINKKPKKYFGIFSEDDMVAIKDAVKRAEAVTSGEIRVKIRQSFDKGINTIDEQVLRDFEHEGLPNTRDHTGILILLVVGEKQFAIHADKGIYAKLPDFYWRRKLHGLMRHFRGNTPTVGLVEVIDDIGYWLSRFFPRKPNDVNELPDEVITEGGR